VRAHLGEANVFSFGIGSSVNRFLVDGIAKAGQGEPFVVLDQTKASDAAARFRAYVEQPVLTKVKVAFDGLQTYDVQPSVLPDVFASRPVVVFGKYKGTPAGKITLTGVSGRGRFVSTIDASTVAPDAKHSALSFLWARAKISELSDFYQGDANRKQVVELGLKYNLLTKFTSFIAVQQVVRATPGSSTDVDQPLPMPAGVSDLAVGMEVGAEPELLLLIALVALGVLISVARSYRRRRLA
jgi:Ca-activated chloride channel family protein